MKKVASCLIFLLLMLTVVQIPVHAVNSQSRSEVGVEFKVYPDGTVELAGEYLHNYTFPYPYEGASDITFSVEILGEDSSFRVKTNGSVVFPEDQASRFPLNATRLFFGEEFSQNVSRTTVNGSIIFPERWTGSLFPPYSDEQVSLDFNAFPFNSTDLTISGEYSNGTYHGTITFHFIPGLTLGDVEINIEGNATHLRIYDSIDIFYNQTLPIPGFIPPDRAMIEELAGDKAYIDEILDELTGGLITCESYNVTMVPTGDTSDTIYFDIILRGDFIGILTSFFGGFSEEFIPPGEGNMDETIRDLANITTESIEEFSFNISYVRAVRELNFKFHSLVNWEKTWSLTKELIIDNLPPEAQPDIRKLIGMRRARLESYTEKATYRDGELKYSGDYVFTGDVNAEANLIRRLFIDLAAGSSTPPPMGDLAFANETQIVDVSGFRFEISQSVKHQTNVVSMRFQRIKIAPSIDPINATCFKLRKLFGFAHSLYMPERGVKVRLTVKGESNGTHTVVPTIDPTDPEKPPAPDEILSGNIFIWNNISLSQLKGLTFQVHSGFAQFMAERYVSPEKPYVIDALDIANCQIAVNSIQGNVTVIVRNITLPEDVNPPPETYKVLGSYVQITSTGGEINGNFTIKMYYEPEELIRLGVSEDSLKIYFWDTSAGEWTPVETNLNSEEHYVWANVNHLSIWAVMGEIAAKPIWAETWFIAVVAGIILLVIAVVAILATRRKVSY